MKIEKASEIGFCFGVKRAIELVERVARDRGSVETMGPLVHNQQVLQRLAGIGVRIASKPEEIKGDTVVLSTHGANRQIEERLRARNLNIIDTTCPFVRRAQVAGRRLAESGFFVIIYGDAEHTEVKSVLAWAGGKGIATLDDTTIARLNPLPRRLGVLSQTTQIPAHFTEFVKRLIDSAFVGDSELRIIDTICHDIRKRQAAAIELASKADLMLVIGGHNSANTNRLAELCSIVVETHLVETADEIQLSWLKGKRHIGLTSGASTAEEIMTEALKKLEALVQLHN